MKLTALFARYLYQHKQLRLPGIGVFTIDPGLYVPDTADKNFPEFLQQIKYSQEPIADADEEFIQFIRTETGKIRPLAESDLDSFLSDGKILLNIGKPFYIEGIGSIQKNKGVYTFTPGDPPSHRPEMHYTDEGDNSHAKRAPFAGIQDQQGKTKKLLIAFSIVAGIILVIWGGYSLYNRNTPAVEVENTGTAAGAIVARPADTAQAGNPADTVSAVSSPSLPAPSGRYRFIIEKTNNKRRALYRYHQLLDIRDDIKMDTPDSISFTLYFILPAQASDTARIRDSLETWYDRRRVYVEKY